MPTYPFPSTFGQLVALSMGAPFVVAQRMAIMAAAGYVSPTRASRNELNRMGAEKWKAASDGMWGMTRSAFDWQYRNWAAMWMPFGTSKVAWPPVSANLRRLPKRSGGGRKRKR